MKAQRGVHDYRVSSLDAQQRQAAWQAFYDAAGLLGVVVHEDYHAMTDEFFARLSLINGGGPVHVTLDLPMLRDVPDFPTYDPNARYGRGMR